MYIPATCLSTFALDSSSTHSPKHTLLILVNRLRKIASEDVPSANLYGCDLRPEFFDLGYRLFRDKETLKSRFLVADIFDPSLPLSSLYGRMDIIYAGSFLHLFGYAKQVEICKQIVKLLRDKKGSMLLGRQVGNLDAGVRVHDTNGEGIMFRHNSESFKKMWDEVGELTGTKWRVESEMIHLGMFSSKMS